jgi:hypothetical protein
VRYARDFVFMPASGGLRMVKIRIRRQGGICRAFSLCVLAFIVVFNACDSRGSRGGTSSVAGDIGRGGVPPPDSNAIAAKYTAVVSLDEALAAVDAYSYVGSVENQQLSNESQELNESLKRGLRSALANTGKDRFTADVPTGDDGRIRDIAYDMDTLALTWTYSNDGDYDLDGSVGVPDITSIANNYLNEVNYSEEQYSDGRPIPSGDPATIEGAANWYLAFIDTDKSGDIGIADITAIANNYLNDVAGYAVFANDDPNAPIDEWTEVTRITLAEAKSALLEGFTFPITFTATITEDDGLFAMVRPYDSTGAFGDASDIVPLSTSVAPKIYGVKPTSGIEGDIETFQVVSTGVAPMTYRWNISGAFPSSSTKESPTVILSTPGEYTCSVSATNDFGTDYFQFTLTVDEVPLPEYQTAFAVAGAYPQYADAPLTTQLVCNMSYSVAGEIVYYEWDFESDGENDVYQTEPYHISHEYPAGEYTATLTVMDEAGSKGAAEVKILSLSPEMQWETVKELTLSGGIKDNMISVFINPLTGGLPAMAYVTGNFKHCFTYEEYVGKWTTDTFLPTQQPTATFAPPIMLPDGSVIYAAMYITLSGSSHIGYVKRDADGTWDPPNYVELSIGTTDANLLSAVRPDGQPALLYNVGSTGDVIRYSWWNGESWTREDTGIRGKLQYPSSPFSADFGFFGENPAFLYEDPDLAFAEKRDGLWESDPISFVGSGNALYMPKFVDDAPMPWIIGLTPGLNYCQFRFLEQADGYWSSSWVSGPQTTDVSAFSCNGSVIAVAYKAHEPVENIHYSILNGFENAWQSGIIIVGADLEVLGVPIFAPGNRVYILVGDSSETNFKLLKGTYD